MATVNEDYKSRRTVLDGTNSSHTRTYKIQDATDDDDAITALLAALVATVTKGGIPLSSRSVKLDEMIEDTTHSATVVWKHQDGPSAPQEELDVGDEEFTIDISGQQVNRTEAISTQSLPSGAPDTGDRINDTGERVDGIGIIVPHTSYQRTKKIAAASINAAWVKDKSQYVGSTNDATFDGFDAGELLLMGISANRRGSSDDWTVTYTFGVSRNETPFALAGESFTGGKKGWEYAWVRYAPGEDATNKALKGDVQGVYLAQVYEEKDFTQLGL